LRTRRWHRKLIYVEDGQDMAMRPGPLGDDASRDDDEALAASGMIDLAQRIDDPRA
jgi:hypothetical protein